MANLLLTNGNVIADMDTLVDTLANGKSVTIEYPTAYGTETKTVRYAKVAEPRFAPCIYVHGASARSLEQILSYIDGDSHDRTKVQFYTGKDFKNFF